MSQSWDEIVSLFFNLKMAGVASFFFATIFPIPVSSFVSLLHHKEETLVLFFIASPEQFN